MDFRNNISTMITFKPSIKRLLKNRENDILC